MKKKIESANEINPFIIGIKYSTLSFIISIIFMVLFALILTNTNVKEDISNTVIIVLSSISILICSFMASRKIKSKGIVLGGILGGTYFGLLYILSSFFSMNFALSIYSVIMLVACILTGMIGGILGVNFVR